MLIRRRLLGLLALLPCVSPALAGCGDFTGATGDEGLFHISLFTHFEVYEGDLRDIAIVTGHPQSLRVRLTDKGEHEIESPEEVTYSVTPATGVVLTPESSPSGPPDLTVLVESAGSYRLDILENGAAVDGVDLRFEPASGVELIVKVRPPFAEDFVTQTAGVTSSVKEGTEVLFLPVPLDAGGERLAGDIVTTATFEPAWAVVPDLVDVEQIYEDGMITSGGEISFFIIEPGIITLTVVDTVSGAMGQHTFDVSPAAP